MLWPQRTMAGYKSALPSYVKGYYLTGRARYLSAQEFTMIVWAGHALIVGAGPVQWTIGKQLPLYFVEVRLVPCLSGQRVRPCYLY